MAVYTNSDNDVTDCLCGEMLSGSTDSGQHLVHHVQHAAVCFEDQTLHKEIHVDIAGTDLLGTLQVGCPVQLIVRCSTNLDGSFGNLLGVEHNLSVMHAMQLPVTHLRSQQMHAALQMAHVPFCPPTQPLQHLLDALRVALGLPANFDTVVSWYMLASMLLSAVAVGEHQRAAKVAGHKRHRCQVCQRLQAGPVM